jgi:hypothetical protein
MRWRGFSEALSTALEELPEGSTVLVRWYSMPLVNRGTCAMVLRSLRRR